MSKSFVGDFGAPAGASQSSREQTELMRLFMKHAPVALAMFDRNMRYIVASQRWMMDYGLNESVIGRSHYDVFPEVPARWRDVHKRGLAGETIREEEDRFDRADGGMQWLRWEVRPWLSDTGEIGGIVILTEDITSRKQAEAERERLQIEITQRSQELRAEQRFRALVESAPDAMVIVSAEGKIVLANSRAEELFSYSRQELLQQPVELLLPDRFRAIHVGHRGEYSAEPHARPMGAGRELFGRRKDGSEFPAEVSLSPLETAEGLLVSSAIRDISDRKRILEQLREARNEAERASRAKSTFLATASHDLRQPMQTLSLLNGALRRLVKEVDAVEALTQQEAAIAVMSRLLNALLDISKLESGAVKPVLTNWQLITLLDQLRSEFASIAADKGLQLEVECSGACVRSDLSLVGQVLRNLVSNAIKYTKRGQVLLRGRPEGEVVRVEVIDTGIGMAPEELGHIYEEFYQIGVTATATREGYGLGLSIVSRIIKLLNLKLDARSEVGKGSTFSLELPTGTAITDASGRQGAASGIENSAKSVHHILIVEDEPAVLNAMRMLLRAEGYKVTTASSLAEAVACARESPDLELLLTDYHLAGGETGTQVITSVRAVRGPRLKVIMITGDTSSAARAFEGHEALCFLSKPVDPRELLNLLDNLLGRTTPTEL
jgi:two-component system, sensor histidine kinase